MTYGHDRRRRLSESERRWLYERAGGRCENCGTELGPDYHSAHLAAWINGGGTRVVENMQAWCPTCNLRLGPHDVEEAGGIALRRWQAQALPHILRRLYQSGVATLHASPGAGKTIFAGATFKHLLDAGLVERIVVVVPNRALVDQWAASLAEMRIHVDTQARDGVIEHPDTVGVVTTYQSVVNSAKASAARMAVAPTLVVLDEVHHVGEPGKAAWGTAVQTMVGDVNSGTIHAAGVLNMTGTLFRSSNKQRISTVRYDRVTTDEGEKLQAGADWSEPTSNLIGVELRAPDLYAYSGEVRMIDIREEEIVTGDIADLDRSQRSAVIRGASEKTWLRGFTAEAIRMLQNQLIAINHEEPLKLLYVANDIKSARRAADAINKATKQNFARLVTSDEPGAIQTLRNAAREPNSCAIVSVRMVTEGFDCPHIATIAYATNISADLFIAQMMARAMRITGTERANGRMLPAQILIPDNPDLRNAFASAMVSTMHLLDVPDENAERTGVGAGIGEPRLLRYQLLDLSDPQLRSATVLGHDDGEIPKPELDDVNQHCLEVGIPETYSPRVALVARRHQRPVTVYSQDEESAPAGGTAVMTTPADPRSLNLAHRAVLKQAAGWMNKHIDHDQRYESVQMFQGAANHAAGIPTGGRDQASVEKLERAARWMKRRVLEHCRTHGENPPSWAEEE